jgi:hypothetical protein
MPNPEIPSAAFTFFKQATAPVGWEKLTTNNEHTLRVVAFGNTPGGTVNFTSVHINQPISGPISVSGAVGAVTLSNMGAHTHPSGGIPGSTITGRGNGGGSLQPLNSPVLTGFTPSPAVTGPAGGGGSHTHPLSATAVAATGSFQMDIKYVDIIHCRRN